MKYESSSIGELWRQLLEDAVEKNQTTEDDGIELLELLNVKVEIDLPITPPEEDAFLSENMDPEMVEWMYNNFLSEDPVEDWGYSYGSRLKDFHGEDQLEYITEKLTRKPTSKSATISFMNPPEDKKHVPCICVLDFKLRDGLLMTVFFRSEDIGKKFYADMLSLKKIYEKVADRLNAEKNKIVVYICSAHIYETEYNKVDEMLEEKEV